MLEEVIKLLEDNSRALVLRNKTILGIGTGKLSARLKELDILKEDVKTVYSTSEDTSILSVKDVVNHDIDLPLMRVDRASGECSWSSPKHIRTIRRAVAVV
jgi:hypothetical protein